MWLKYWNQKVNLLNLILIQVILKLLFFPLRSTGKLFYNLVFEHCQKSRRMLIYKGLAILTRDLKENIMHCLSNNNIWKVPDLTIRASDSNVMQEHLIFVRTATPARGKKQWVELDQNHFPTLDDSARGVCVHVYLLISLPINKDGWTHRFIWLYHTPSHLPLGS